MLQKNQFDIWLKLCPDVNHLLREEGDVWVWRCLELLTVGCQRKCQTGSRAEVLLFWCKSGLSWAMLDYYWAGLGWTTGLGWAGLGWAGLGWAGWAGWHCDWIFWNVPCLHCSLCCSLHTFSSHTLLHWTLVRCSQSISCIMRGMLLNECAALELYSSFNQWMVDCELVIHLNRKSGRETSPVKCCRLHTAEMLQYCSIVESVWWCLCLCVVIGVRRTESHSELLRKLPIQSGLLTTAHVWRVIENDWGKLQIGRFCWCTPATWWEGFNSK